MMLLLDRCIWPQNEAMLDLSIAKKSGTPVSENMLDTLQYPCIFYREGLCTAVVLQSVDDDVIMLVA